MRVLLTGAFGMIGRETLSSLLAQGHQVCCVERKTRQSQRYASRLPRHVEICWGDVRDPVLLRGALAGCGAVIHNAGVLPPTTEQDPRLAEAINVGATRQLLSLMAQVTPGARLIYASSFAIYGVNPARLTPLTSETPIAPSDHYTHHKATCEAEIRDSELDWVIMRIGAALSATNPPRDIGRLRELFEIQPAQRLEVVDARDAGLAQANAVLAPNVSRRVVLIGGGVACQVTFRHLFSMVEEMLGCGELPAGAFGARPYYTDWLDTVESQSLLRYQRTSFADICEESRHYWRHVRRALRPLSPLVRWGLLRLSDPWRSGGRTGRWA